ncbi:MAG: hypothetical protein AAGA95_13925, partial [Pseudomonadota bacterium]
EVLRLVLQMVETFARRAAEENAGAIFVGPDPQRRVAVFQQRPALRQDLSSRVPENAQGELQGGLSALTSVAMILSPVIYNGLFTLTAGDTPLFYFPGSPFVVAACMSVLALALYTLTNRSREVEADARHTQA